MESLQLASLNGESWNVFLSKIRNKTRMFFLPSIQHYTGHYLQKFQARKERKGIQSERKEVKISVITDDMGLYVEKS